MDFPAANSPSNKLPARILGCLDRGGAVITGNARAARSLRRLHTQAQPASGKKAWSTPLIYDWMSWLDVLWKQHLQQAADAPLLLTALQERAVWKRIVAGPAAGSESVAEMASHAWSLLSDFHSHSERIHSWSTAAANDAEVFRGWAARFDRECRANRWLSRSDLPALLTTSLQQGELSAPQEVMLLGFDRLTPAQQALLNAARSAGCTVTIFDAPKTSELPTLMQAADQNDELTTCAWWTRRTLEDNPDASIAIVVQDIDTKRGDIEHTLRRVLMPESLGIEANDPMPFEFSLGVPLASVPLIKAALSLLQWLSGPLEQGTISWLTTSGFLAADGEHSAEIAAFDAEIRKYGRLPPRVSLEAFNRYSPRGNSESVRRFLSRLRGLQRSAQTEVAGSRKKSFPEWIDFAEQALHDAQWPGNRTLESREHQARSRWERLLGEVAGLGFDASRVGWSEFVTVLDRYAAETIFAPESRDAPIQIMGAFESAGQHFDALWFLGVDDRQWPPAGEPSALLPSWLQRKAAMPHSSIDAEWTLNLAITRRLANSAPQCVFSHARRDQAGELRPSALIAETLGTAPTSISSDELRANLYVSPEPLHQRLTQWMDDNSSIPWPTEIHAGGADILKRQSACAFQSFAIRRLGAEDLEDAERGLNPRDRGNILHSVMEAFWSKNNSEDMLLRDREDLINVRAAGRLPEILRRHITEVFQEQRRNQHGDEWSNAYMQAEQDRLYTVLTRWLDYELERRPFTVEDQEKPVEANINGLQLKLRVDRIDQVDGGRLIVDYKTGTVTTAMWNGDRPDEPQLPLYGIHGHIDYLRGVLFAQVRANIGRFIGYANDVSRTITNQPKSNLRDNSLTTKSLEEWSRVLDSLANDFLNGNAEVAPKSYPKTCKYCALAALCRVAETPVVIEANDEEEDEAFGEVFSNG